MISTHCFLIDPENFHISALYEFVLCEVKKYCLHQIPEIDIYFQLDFPSTATTTDYARMKMGRDMTAATVCFWMKSDDTQNQGTPFSYATADGDNIFTLTDYDGFVLNYHKVPKFSDARKPCCNQPKIQTKRPKPKVFYKNGANGIANSENPDQIPPVGAG